VFKKSFFSKNWIISIKKRRVWIVHLNSRKSTGRSIRIKSFELNDRRLFVFPLWFLPNPSVFFPYRVYVVGAYRCTRRVQFYEGGRVGVPTGMATFNKGRGHVYICVLGVLVSTALGAVDDVAVWTRIA